jgi:hypothetical protein
MGMLGVAFVLGLGWLVVWSVSSSVTQGQSACNNAKATVHSVAQNDPKDLNKVTDMMVAICND